MKAVCALEERHSADVGEGYKNDRSCSVFVEFIACDQQEHLVADLTGSKFFTLQAALTLGILFLVLYLDFHSAKGTQS